MTMTPEAKTELRKVIRGTPGSSNGGLRQKLLDGLQTETERIYRLAIKDVSKAGLKEAEKAKRLRLQDWLDDQVRMDKAGGKRKADVFLKQAVKQAAYTLLNRLVILRLMEGMGLRRPLVLTGGWNSPGYRDFRAIGAAIARHEPDRTEGYAFLLQLIFEELSTDLPGLYGSAGIADLIPVPSELLKAVVEAFDDPQLQSCWSDDMTLGWIYQYWNDPDREDIDRKLKNSGKVEPHEIASKTQMFTERYMVDWLLQNSLGPMWLAMCRRHGWTPDCEANGTLQALEERRVDWRTKREERQAALASRVAASTPTPSTRRPVTTDDKPVEESLLEYEIDADADEDSETSEEVLASSESLSERPESFIEQDDDSLPGVSLTALMPLHNDEERRWAYYVPQPIPDDAIQHAPDSVRNLKLLDPAVGSGHFLVVAFDLLFALYKEEARHRQAVSTSSFSPSGEKVAARPDEWATPISAAEFNPAEWTNAVITERILEHNLHGIDLDPRAVQIAAAALWLKAQTVCPAAQPKQLNLVASNLGITALADDDPALVELRRVVEVETGVPAALTNQIIEALRGADHLGSLLKVDAAIEAAIASYEDQIGWKDKVIQLRFDENGRTVRTPRPISRDWATTGILSALENFLSRHTSAEELGLRLAGEQLAAGVRFLRMVKEGTYDLVVANPPYQGTAKMANATYVAEHYELGKSDLFAAFLLRGLELVREHGVSGMLTMRNWMFIKQYSDLRQHLLETYDLRALGDLSTGAFQEINAAQVVVSVAMACFWRDADTGGNKVAVRAFLDDYVLKPRETDRKRAATLCQIGYHTFAPSALNVVPEWPLVYWWSQEELTIYAQSEKLGDVAPVRQGMASSNNARFLRSPWENRSPEFRPYLKGGAGRAWYEPLSDVIEWANHGLAVKLNAERLYGSYTRTIKNEEFYFRPGAAFSKIGSIFAARIMRYPSIFDVAGSAVFVDDPRNVCCLLNSRRAKEIVTSLNPTVNYQVGDVNRLPLLPISDTNAVYAAIDQAFLIHEHSREPSIEFQLPGPSPWRTAQSWAQSAVDREIGSELKDYDPICDPEPPTDHISFAVGVALGRFGSNGEGVLDPETADCSQTLPHGILFLDGTLTDNDRERDGLGHPATRIIHEKWATYSHEIAPGISVRQWLRTRFFADVHKGMYQNRPIHSPLTSANKTFVAWINIHRWNARTLTNLLAMLQNTFRRIEGELNDMRKAADGKDAAAARGARDRMDDVRAWKDELENFIKLVEQCADKGPPSPELPPGKEPCPPREVDAAYDPNLDDGVMINSAALWPLLDPVWKDPKKWWEELCRANPQGNKDYDWSHLAMKYWPTRVDKKCQSDPSLAVAHGCFWKYHPAKAWKWELRLQDEIGPDFRIEEAPYRGDGGDTEHRTAYLAAEPKEALEAVEKELMRRRGKGDEIKIVSEMTLLESGLWTALPEVCWEIESKFIKKQKAAFVLKAPDEAKARKELLKSNPALKRGRTQQLNRLAPHDPFASVGVIGEES
jgi:hypothetical protein